MKEDIKRLERSIARLEERYKYDLATWRMVYVICVPVAAAVYLILNLIFLIAYLTSH